LDFLLENPSKGKSAVTVRASPGTRVYPFGQAIPAKRGSLVPGSHLTRIPGRSTALLALLPLMAGQKPEDPAGSAERTARMRRERIVAILSISFVSQTCARS